MQLNLVSADRLSELWESGEINRAEVLREIQLTPAYYGQPASREWLGERYRQSSAAAAKAAHIVVEHAFAIDELITDLMIEQITPAQFDYCLREWRKLPDSPFLPKLVGPFLEILRKGGFAAPSKGQGERHVDRLRALVDPQYTAKPMPKFNGQRTQVKDEVSDLTPEHRAEIVAMCDKRNGILKAIPMTKSSPADLAEATNQTLMKLADSVEVVARANNFHTVIAINGKTKTEIKSFMTFEEANEYKDNAK